MRFFLFWLLILIASLANGQDFLERSGRELVDNGFAKPLAPQGEESFLKLTKSTLQRYSKQRAEIERALSVMSNDARCEAAASATSGIKAIVDLLLLSAYEATSEGDLTSATKHYGLAFKACRYLEDSTWEGVITAAALRTLCYSEISSHLSSMSLGNSAQLSDIAGSLISNDAYISAVRKSEDKAQATLADAFGSEANVSNSEEAKQVASLLSEITPAERTELGVKLRLIIRDRFANFRQQFEDPRSAWLDAPAVEGLEASILSTLPGTSNDHWRAAYLWCLRDTTKAKLLRLHCGIRIYFLNQNRLPSNLGEITPGIPHIDALNGQPYRYEIISSGNYKLFSLGTPETGPIDLRLTDPIY